MDTEVYQQVLDLLGEGVYFVDLNRRVTYWNKAAERLSGYAAQEVVGKRCADNILRHVDELGQELCRKGCPLAATIRDGQTRETEVYMHHKFGHRVPVLVRATPMRDKGGAIVGAIEVFSHNVEYAHVLKELETLRKETLSDPLTGTGNRRYGQMVMRSLETSWAEHQVPFGVIMADIDHFKKVNDTLGHATGDLVLNMVAGTLKNGLRALDVPCRWGGEEFLLLVPNTNAAALLGLAERLRMLVEHSWLEHEGDRIHITASFGAAVSRAGETAEELVARADKMLYASKRAGRNRVSLEE